jgi:hypothetical protein
MALLLSLAASGVGQTQQLDSVSTRALRHGRLIVWTVRPVDPLKGVRMLGIPDQTPMTYQERTAATFGTNAGDYGMPASSYGVATTSPTIARRGTSPATNDVAPGDADAALAAAQGYKEVTAGNFGQVSSEFGTVASDHGQTNGSFGQTASSYGTVSGNYGQTVGSFGNSLSTIATAGEPKRAEEPVPLEDDIGPALRATFPDLKLQFVNVDVRDLKKQLSAVDSSKYPDVLILDGFAASWPGLPQDVQDALYMETSGPVSFRKPGYADERLAPRWLITRKAQHPAAARALVAYMALRAAPRTSTTSGQ